MEKDFIKGKYEGSMYGLIKNKNYQDKDAVQQQEAEVLTVS